MEQLDLQTLERLPPPHSSRIIDFESMRIVTGIVPETFILIVDGQKPWLTMTVTLQPLVYAKRPEYWGIEVVATQVGIAAPTVAPYQAVLDITHYRGTKGIEVIGATKREKHKV